MGGAFRCLAWILAGVCKSGCDDRVWKPCRNQLVPNLVEYWPDAQRLRPPSGRQMTDEFLDHTGHLRRMHGRISEPGFALHDLLSNPETNWGSGSLSLEVEPLVRSRFFRLIS
jgi:hypothetical protein